MKPWIAHAEMAANRRRRVTITRGPNAWAIVFLVLVLAVALTGCNAHTAGVSTGPMEPCPTCVGAYDLGLSSHREALSNGR